MAERHRSRVGHRGRRSAGLPLGIITRTVPCPKDASTDALLIATWRADQFKKPLATHLKRARKLIDSAPGRFAPQSIGLSDNDLRTFERLGCGDDVEACLVAAWLAVGVEKFTGKVSRRSSWDCKLYEPRMKQAAVY